MTHDTLAIIWFGIWGVIWAVYFVLDGYTLGTGMLFPFLAKTDQEQKQLQETIGPFWGGNEVWLITAGGATFAAFPEAYALMFSYLYSPLFLILFALFFRAIGLEFMYKHSSMKWRSFWKWAFFAGSTAIALLFGVAFANLFYGLLIDAKGYQGNLLTLLHPYGLLGGITFISLFLLSGSLWIDAKTSGTVNEKAHRLSRVMWFVTTAVVAIFLVATGNRTPLFDNFAQYPLLWIVPGLALAVILVIPLLTRRSSSAWAFGAICTAIFLFIATGFIGMFPNMLPSKLDAAYSLTLFEAKGSLLNLKIMFFVAIFIVPVVIFYQSWMYRIFREKITPEDAKGY